MNQLVVIVLAAAGAIAFALLASCADQAQSGLGDDPLATITPTLSSTPEPELDPAQTPPPSPTAVSTGLSTAEVTAVNETRSNVCDANELGDLTLGLPVILDLDVDGDDDAVVPVATRPAGPGKLLELDVFERVAECGWNRVATVLEGDGRDADHNTFSYRWSCTGEGVLSQVRSVTHPEPAQHVTNLTLSNGVVTTHQLTTVASSEPVDESAWIEEAECWGVYSSQQVDRCGGIRWTATLPADWFTPVVGRWSCQVFSGGQEGVPCQCDRVFPLAIGFEPGKPSPPIEYLGRTTIDGYPAWVTEHASYNQMAGSVTRSRTWSIDIGDGVISVRASNVDYSNDPHLEFLGPLVDELASSLEIVGDERPTDPFPELVRSSSEDIGGFDEIAQVDFWNGFEYPHAGGLVVDAGIAATGQLFEPGFQRLAIKHVAVGDLTGDGVNEAVVHAVSNGGGSGFFPHLWVYELVGGKPQLRSTMSIAEAEIREIAGVAVVDGELRLDALDGPIACCPDRIERQRWKLTADQLSLVGTELPQRFVEMRLLERDSLDLSPLPGTSATVLRLTGASGSVRRFFIDAEPGASLRVTSSSRWPRLRLFVGGSGLPLTLGGSITLTSDSPEEATLYVDWPAPPGDLVYLELSGPDGELVAEVEALPSGLAPPPQLSAERGRQSEPVKVGVGAAIALSPDGSNLITIGTNPLGHMGCEAATNQAFWLQPVDGSQRRVAAYHEIASAGVDLFTVDFGRAAWVEFCDGILRGPFVADMAADGSLANIATVPWPSANVGFANWVHALEWHDENSLRMMIGDRTTQFASVIVRAADGAVLEQNEVTNERPGLRFPTSEFDASLRAWKVPTTTADELELFTLSRYHGILRPAVVDAASSTAYVTVEASHPGWSDIVAVSLDDAEPVPSRYSGPIGGPSQVSVRAIVALEGRDAWIAWRPTIDECAGDLLIVDHDGSTIATLLADIGRPFAADYDGETLALLAGCAPQGFEPISGRLADDSLVDVRRTEMRLRDFNAVESTSTTDTTASFVFSRNANPLAVIASEAGLELVGQASERVAVRAPSGKWSAWLFVGWKVEHDGGDAMTFSNRDGGMLTVWGDGSVSANVSAQASVRTREEIDQLVANVALLPTYGR